MDQLEFYYIIAITFAIVASMVITYFICADSIILTKRSKHSFYFVFGILIFGALCDLGASWFDYLRNPSLNFLSYFCNFMYFAIIPLVPIVLSRILYRSKSLRSNIPLMVYGVYLVAITIMVATKTLFYIDEVGAYHRHPVGFYIYIGAFILSTLYLLIDSIILSKKLLSTNPYVLFVLFLVLLGGTTVQILVEDVHFLFLVVSVLAIIFYDYVAGLWARMDGLTGLYSQYAFIRRSKYIKEGDAIFIMDADDFKTINDKYGHFVGDEVLKAIAKVIQDVFGKYGRCFRYGGDEFIAIIKKGNDFDKLIADFKSQLGALKEKESVVANVSIGYQIYDKSMTIEVLEDVADKKMYEDKLANKRK